MVRGLSSVPICQIMHLNGEICGPGPERGAAVAGSVTGSSGSEVAGGRLRRVCQWPAAGFKFAMPHFDATSGPEFQFEAHNETAKYAVQSAAILTPLRGRNFSLRPIMKRRNMRSRARRGSGRAPEGAQKSLVGACGGLGQRPYGRGLGLGALRSSAVRYGAKLR